MTHVKADRRRGATHSRDELPVGTIRIRNRRRGSRCCRVRFIKVRSSLPRAGQWRPLARVWWEENRGPVPGGLGVAHADGDTLNDDPSNYQLMTSGEVALLHLKRASTRRKMETRRAAAMGEFNRMKGTAMFFARRPTKRWYLADTANGVIYYTPSKSRSGVFRLRGIAVPQNGVLSKSLRDRLAAQGLTAVRGTQLRDDPWANYSLRHPQQSGEGSRSDSSAGRAANGHVPGRVAGSIPALTIGDRQ